MKERPILMSAPMVRALLEGRKTQTRRALKPQSTWHNTSHPTMIGNTAVFGVISDGYPKSDWKCPYGQPGDRLYVREAFSYTYGYGKDDVGSPIWYWADGNPEHGDFTKPKPSIHIPRWASRILLEITDVRVERLQDISEEDARAEGIWELDEYHDAVEHAGAIGCGTGHIPTMIYRQLWERINGNGSWDANPWVWVIEFRRTGHAK